MKYCWKGPKEVIYSTPESQGASQPQTVESSSTWLSTVSTCKRRVRPGALLQTYQHALNIALPQACLCGNNANTNPKILPSGKVIFHKAIIISKDDILAIFQFGCQVYFRYIYLRGILFISTDAPAQKPLSELDHHLLAPVAQTVKNLPTA